MNPLDGRFCPKPFEFFELSRNDLERVQTHACCPSWLPMDLGDARAQSVTEIWNNEILKSLRESIHDGTFRFCDHSLCPEIVMGTLPRKEEIHDPYLKDIIKYKKTEVSKGPRVLNLSNDRTCNIKCPSCRTDYIATNSGPEFERLKEVHEKVWQESLKDLELAIFSSTGDPFASKATKDLLLNLDGRKFPKLKIQLNTNGILLTPDMWNSLHKIHKNIYKTLISLDAASEKVYNFTRRGGDFKKVLNNIRHLCALKREGKFSYLRLDFVVQNENYIEMKDFVEMGIELGVDAVYFQRIINWETYSRSEFKKHAVWKKGHPNYKHFLGHLRDPIFKHPIVEMGNCAEFIPYSE